MKISNLINQDQVQIQEKDQNLEGHMDLTDLMDHMVSIDQNLEDLMGHTDLMEDIDQEKNLKIKKIDLAQEEKQNL